MDLVTIKSTTGNISLKLYRQILFLTNPFLLREINTLVPTKSIISGINAIYVQTDLQIIRHPLHVILESEDASSDPFFDNISTVMNEKFLQFNSLVVKYIERLTNSHFNFHFENYPEAENHIVMYAFNQPIGIITVGNIKRIESVNYNNIKYITMSDLDLFLINISKTGLIDSFEDILSYPKCRGDIICFLKKYFTAMINLSNIVKKDECLSEKVLYKNYYECSKKTIIGNKENPLVLKDILKQTDIKYLNDTLLKSLSHIIRYFPLQIKDDIQKLVTKTLHAWSVNSTVLTNLMKTYVFAKFLGEKFELPADKKQQISDLQYACTFSETPEDMIVYKTSRMVTYNGFDNSSDLEIGGVYQQYLFNSTTIDMAFDTSQFSELDYGNSAFIIRLPKGTKCGYLGNDLIRTKYPQEMELLLPVGCRFRIANVYRNYYIYTRGRYYKIVYYLVDYIPPKEEYMTQDFSMDMLSFRGKDSDSLPELFHDIKENVEDSHKRILNHFRRVINKETISDFLTHEIKRIAATENLPIQEVEKLVYQVATQKKIKIDLKNLGGSPQSKRETKLHFKEKPKKKWNIMDKLDYSGLSYNLSITPEFVESHPNKPWDWYGLSKNPSITPEFVESHPDKPWDWDGLSRNPSITPEFVESHPEKPWDWDGLSRNPGITPEFVESHPNKPWDWYGLSYNPSITPEFVESHLDKPWYWDGLSRNPNITLEFVESHLDKQWNWYGLSKNPSIITPEFVESHPEKPWDWDGLSSNPSFTPEYIASHPNKPWDWWGLSSNPSFTPEYITSHPDNSWDWDGLSMNPSITPEFVESHLEKPWDWGVSGLSMNPSITPEFVESHLEKPWDWGGLSENKNITPEFVESHSDKPWD